MDRYEAAIEPFTKGRGIDWEVQIEEVDVSTSLPILLAYLSTGCGLENPASSLERERHKSTVARYRGRKRMEGPEQSSAVLVECGG